MRIIHKPLDLKSFSAEQKALNKTIGFVPTMGALHDGHVSLVERSLNENHITIVSIYLNPTQFNNSEDLSNYPVSWEKDCSILDKLGVDVLFAPDYDSIYPDLYTYKLLEQNLSSRLCGAARPGHFDGVLTVVMKLLHIADPANAYFGEKDYQQLQLIRGMVKAFFMNVNIIGCPLIREDDGLAMSSRNRRLSSEGRSLAPRLYQILTDNSIRDIDAKKTALKDAGFEIDYLEQIDGRLYVAVFLEGIRLIDNVAVKGVA